MATHGAERSTHESGSRAAEVMPSSGKGSAFIHGAPGFVAVPVCRFARDFRRDCRE
jgi:hypothetical protein